MHPAPSIIVFTVLSGLGYGLAFVLGLGLLDPATLATKLAWLASIAMIGTGLLASTFHLGNPQRAWRAFSQWRSSWLSREGVLSVATFAPLLWAAWVCVIESRTAPWAGWLVMLGAAATVFCTSMIYAQLKSVDAWHTWLTPACFLAFSLSGGLILAALAAAAARDHNAAYLAVAGAGATAITWALKQAWRRRVLSMAPTSNAASATRLGALGSVRQFEPPHMTANYLTSEMVFRIGRKHANKLFRLAILSGAAAVFLLLLAGAPILMGHFALGLSLIIAAAAAYSISVATERWLFFAEARHAVSSFYGS